MGIEDEASNHEMEVVGGHEGQKHSCRILHPIGQIWVFHTARIHSQYPQHTTWKVFDTAYPVGKANRAPIAAKKVMKTFWNLGVWKFGMACW